MEVKRKKGIEDDSSAGLEQTVCLSLGWGEWRRSRFENKGCL